MEKSLHSRRLLSSFPCPPPTFSHICSLPLGPVCCAPLDIFFHSLTNALVGLTGFPGKYFVSCTDPTRCVLLKNSLGETAGPTGCALQALESASKLRQWYSYWLAGNPHSVMVENSQMAHALPEMRVWYRAAPPNEPNVY